MSDPIDKVAHDGRAAELAELLAWSGEPTALGARLELPHSRAGSASAPASSEAQADGTCIGRYTLLEKLGEGGFGAVFMAEQQNPVRRKVALKIIKLGMDTKQVIARFDAERQALAMMDHPNIARVLDVGATDAGRPYFVMDLIRGKPITRYADDHKLTIRQRLDLFVQVCQAVQHAHTKGIIHRDLKPSNVLVTVAEGVAVPKVIDFGIAKATTGQLTDMTLLTELRQFLGTPQYMSPEQADGGADIDTRTDIYSLGVLLYELLAGATPFDAEELRTKGYREIQRIVREVEPPRPSTRLSALGATVSNSIAASRATDAKRLAQMMRGELDWIVLRALEKDRARRYQTAASLATDVQRHLHDEPVLARPPSRTYRFHKVVRRNRLAFAAAAVLLLTLAVGLITSTSLYIKARNAKTAESALRDDAEANAYASDMLGVQQALSVYNLGRARMLLDRHRPKPGEKDRRGWEWRYLWAQCRGDEKVGLCQRTAAVGSLSVSHDGRWLAVGEREGGGLSIWDLQTRKELPHPAAGETRVRVTFSPREPLLAFTSITSDAQGRPHEEVHIWDIRTASVAATTPLNDFSQGMAFSPDGKTLLVSTARERTGYATTDQGELIFLHVPTLAKDRSYVAPNVYDDINSVFAVTPDFRMVAVAPDGKIRVINLVTGNEQWTKNVGSGWLTSLTFSPDGRVLAFSVGTAGEAIHLLDAATGEPLGPPLEGHLAWVGALCFLPGGRTLVSAGADQMIRLWDVSDPAHVKPIGRPLRGHQHEVWRLALLPDGKTLVSGAKDGSVYVWDTSAVRHDQSHQVISVISWDFGTDGATLFTVDREGHVLRRQGRDFQERHCVFDISGKIDVAWVCDHGRRLNLHFADGTCAFWDLESMRELRPHPKGWAVWAAVTPEHYFLLYYGSENEAVVWDPVNAREVGAPWHPVGGVNPYATTADGRWRIMMSYGGIGTITAASSGRSKTLNLDMRDVVDASFSPDGILLAVASDYGFVGLWKTTDLVAGGTVPPAARLGGFTLAPCSVSFSSDGRRLAAGDGGNEAIKLWDVETRQEVLTLAANGSNFSQTRFSPDGNVLASRNGDDELHIWRAPTQAEIDAAEAGHVVP